MMTEFNTFCDKLNKSMAENLPMVLLSSTQREKLYILCTYLIEQNELFNLTAITDIDSVIVKHIVDCIAPIKYIKENATVIDIGCGGGFPTLPLAIMREDAAITALDSTAKKLEFVKRCAEKCGIINVSALNMRAEAASNDIEYREKFDVAISRAVARLNILAELCIPFIRVGGSFVAMKGNASKEEFDEARNAIFKLGASKTKLDLYSIKSGDEISERGIISAVKTTSTAAKYPRQFAKIKKSPL